MHGTYLKGKLDMLKELIEDDADVWYREKITFQYTREIVI